MRPVGVKHSGSNLSRAPTIFCPNASPCAIGLYVLTLCSFCQYRVMDRRSRGERALRPLQRLVNADAAAEDAHHFAGILGRLRLAPFANFGVAKAIEGVNGVIDACGRTDN